MEEIDIHAKLAQIETAPHFSMIFDGDTEKAEMIAEHLMWLHSIRRERPLVSRPWLLLHSSSIAQTQIICFELWIPRCRVSRSIFLPT